MTNKLLFLWDIDGTLLLSGGAGKIAFERVFAELYGSSYVWKNMRPDGMTDDCIVKKLFENHFGRPPSHEEVAKIAIRYNECMAEEIPRSPNFRLMPHVQETLHWIAQNPAWHCGLATGNYESTAWNKLKHADLHHYFSFGGFGTDSEDRFRLTEIALSRGVVSMKDRPDHIVLIGDTVHDVKCGLSISAVTIAVTTGSTEREELVSAGAHFVIGELSEMRSVLATLHPPLTPPIKGGELV